ncbi:glycoside hydrolase (GH26) [Formosa agariphila KMM 3901]|uniref:Glycoside hydrolase (GH26) n=1 Tax=Formosa agariphila (strain DSM 15362 / KCTC 12365 / LMG 23005 / KMM 3901 / M-2Alg 35-1) TaxID=1347342 RepID=T2KQV1_FORAG|nr:glycosyl hydrolase [Formosa agariphila]CDF80806.1 glycoside hydrolase (GH26) [Formosa agariphila KMM 3901]
MKQFIKLVLISVFIISCSEDSDTLLSSDAELLSFSISELNVNFDILSNNNVVATVEEGVDLKDLTAVFKVSDKANVYVENNLQTSGYSKNDFSNPVVYVVEAEDGTKQNYSVIINVKASVTSFKIKELPDTDFDINGTSIAANVNANTILNNLTAEFTLSDGAELFIGDKLQVSGETKNDFSKIVNYTLKQNNEIVKEYTVIITQAENSLPVANAGEDKIAIITEEQSKVWVELDGSASSDEDGEIVEYKWLKADVVVGNEKEIRLELPLGIHEIELIVTDDVGATASTTITVEVRKQGEYIPIDAGATYETKNLFQKIGQLSNSSQFAFGQEFPMSFKLDGLRTDLSTSDCKDVTGDHPGVFGIDPHYMLYKSNEEKQLHIQEAKYAYNNGAIVTFDFHQQSRNDNKIYFDEMSTDQDKSLVYDIVNDIDGSRDWFYNELDDVVNIINSDLGFPVVFRLYHEMDGDWFWWGTKTKNHSSQLYIQFYQLAVNYIKSKTDLVLFGWTPNQKIDESYYPGDNYVDVVGVDVYDPTKSTLKSNLIELSSFALNHGKVAVLSETGRQGYINSNPTFWTSNILAAIEEGASDIRIAWALAWFNAPWETSQNNLFIPNASSPNNVKDDFNKFYESERTLFMDEIKTFDIYN